MQCRVTFVAVCLLLGTRAQWEHEPDNAYENVECHREGTRVWHCKKDSECPSAGDIIHSGGKLKSCFWKDSFTHVVCCPPQLISQPYKLSVSQRKCAGYTSLLCSDTSYTGPPNLANSIGGSNQVKPFLRRRKRQVAVVPHNLRSIRQILDVQPAPSGVTTEDSFPVTGIEEPHDFVLAAIGGNPANPAEHPHMALIGYGSEDSISWQCGGSLISERFVLSAAHCSNTPYGLARWARLGDLDIRSDTDDARPQQFEIIERRVHQDYKPPAFYNDIVLFRLDRDAVFDLYVGPACLHPSTHDPQGYGIATGWGKNETNGPTSSALVKVDLKFIPIEECKRKAGTLKSLLPNGIDARTMICAGEPGKDTCQGDSGGPLILGDTGSHCLARQVGVTSFGPKNCGRAETTGTYVRVAHFLPWIEAIVWPE